MKTKLIQHLMTVSIILCIACAIWSKETTKWSLTAVYMFALKRWLYKPESEIGKEIYGDLK